MRDPLFRLRWASTVVIDELVPRVEEVEGVTAKAKEAWASRVSPTHQCLCLIGFELDQEALLCSMEARIRVSLSRLVHISARQQGRTQP